MLDIVEWAVKKATPVAIAHVETYIHAANRLPGLPRKSQQIFDLALTLHKGTHHIGQ